MQAALQARLDEIIALTFRRQQSFSAGQAGRFQSVAAFAGPVEERPLQPSLILIHRNSKISAYRNSNFSRSCRGWRAGIGDVVNQRRIRLMANRRDERNFAFKSSADHRFLVERPKVFNRAAAAPDNQHVWPVCISERVKAANTRLDLACRKIALNQSRPQDHAHWKAISNAVKDVADHRTGRAGHNADGGGQEGQRFFVLRVK